MLQTTTWRPDTCGCTIQYTWDDAIPGEQRSHRLVRVEKYCPAHAGLDEQSCYEACLFENQCKNQALAILPDPLEAEWTFGEMIEGMAYVGWADKFVGKLVRGRALMVLLPETTRVAVLAANPTLPPGVTLV